MNILVAVAWMWMAAQHQQQMKACMMDEHCMSVNHITYVGHSDPEHVIEIRTKRWLNGKAKSCDWVTTDGNAHCREIRYDGHCPAGTSCAEEYDYRREIWIDGKKWGVLKESGQ